MPKIRFLLLLLAALLPLTAPLRAQTPPTTPPGGQAPTPPIRPDGAANGLTREQMWFAPTAEDWKKPCLIPWQRSFEDALAVARETRRALLICVNMDGEIASEHYAGVRYRDPEIVKNYLPYVCVIASVYRHTPRDHDEQGRRIPCPRFGTVTCGEHIAIEPGLFDKFFDGQRVAPRHIAIELEKDQAEMYDVYYAFDTDTIFNSLRKGIAERKIEPLEIARHDRPIEERVASADQLDRAAVEQAYAKGDRALRRKLMLAAAASKDAPAVEVLRLAVFGFDLELAQEARGLLAQTNAVESVDLIAEALRVPLDAAQREALIAALGRLAERSPRARTLATVYQGLATRSTAVDVTNWAAALEPGAGAAGPDPALFGRLEYQQQATQAKPEDPLAKLELAESYLALAADPQADPKYTRLFYTDARRVVQQALALGAQGWRPNAVLAVAAHHLGEVAEARRCAELAVQGMPAEVGGLTSMVVLGLFAEVRGEQIIKAVHAKQSWPDSWLADLNSAYAVLLRHPLGTDGQVARHYDFLQWLGVALPAARTLDEGLARFPDSWLLHSRLRDRILLEQGVEGLEPYYEARLKELAPAPRMNALAGYAALIAAEGHRRAGRDDRALASYARSIEHYDRHLAARPADQVECDHYAALDHGGRARLFYERGEDEAALKELLAAFQRRPESAASLDGLNLSAVDTAKVLRTRLAGAKNDALLAPLQAALDALDPKLLELPAYERPVRPEGERRNPNRRRNG